MRTRTNHTSQEERQQIAPQCESKCESSGTYEASRTARSAAANLKTPPQGRRVLIVGAGKVGQTLAHHLQAGGAYHVVGFVDERWGETGLDPAPFDGLASSGWPVLGKRADTPALVERYAIEEVVLAHAPTWQQQLAENLAQSQPHVHVRIVPSFYESSVRVQQVESLGDIALLPLVARWPRHIEIAKRAIDAAVSLFGLIVLMPVALLVAALIKLTSPGAAIFAQERIGLHGRPFRLYKFRTMVEGAEAGSGPTLSPGMQDARLTRIGRLLRLYRADEIPQLWNVLKGEMSLVGPRPERPFFVQKYSQQSASYALRHRVRPGITGMAQVHGGYHTDSRDKLRFDLIYVSHGSLWMDMAILLRTVRVCVWPDKATHAAPIELAALPDTVLQPAISSPIAEFDSDASGGTRLSPVIAVEAFGGSSATAGVVSTAAGGNAGRWQEDTREHTGRNAC